MKKSKTRTRLFLSAAFAAAVLSAFPAEAQELIPGMLHPETGEIIQAPDAPGMMIPGTALVAPSTVPAKTEDVRVAITFYRLTGQLAPFESWARLDPEYTAASDFDRITVLEQKIAAYRELYTQAALIAPFVVEMTANVEPYSFNNKGFLINNFTAEAFFPFSYGGENFAVVAPALADAQWLPVADEMAAMTLDTAAARNARHLRAVIQLTPTYADRRKTVSLEGKEYKVIAAQVSSIAFYEPGHEKLLFDTKISTAESVDPMLQELNALKN